VSDENYVNDLTSDEITKFLNQFDVRCPVCQHDDFSLPTIGGETGRKPILLANQVSTGFNEEGQVMLLGNRHISPDVQLVCQNCTYTMRFDIVSLAEKIKNVAED